MRRCVARRSWSDVGLGFSFVFDTSDVSDGSTGFVGDDLGSSVRQQNLVGAGHDVTVAALLLTVGVLVFIHGVTKVIRKGRLFNQMSIKLNVNLVNIML